MMLKVYLPSGQRDKLLPPLPHPQVFWLPKLPTKQAGSPNHEASCSSRRKPSAGSFLWCLLNNGNGGDTESCHCYADDTPEACLCRTLTHSFLSFYFKMFQAKRKKSIKKSSVSTQTQRFLTFCIFISYINICIYMHTLS